MRPAQTHVLQTLGLTHSFSGGELVLDGIDLRVEAGSIYGFLGANGAGKTTTLRLVLGLLRKQHGSISIFGKPFQANRVEILKKVGSLIESPSFYGHLTAYENLSVLQKVYRCPECRIQEVLGVVGLADTGGKKVGKFSLGMKQRLSIAMALLNEPSLLILDEPTNGLDPNGIIEIRDLLKELNQSAGITIVISSHILAEIERLVSHVGIIHRGRMRFQGTLDELWLEQQQPLSVVFETDDEKRALEIIGKTNVPLNVEAGKFTLPAISRESIAQINRELVMSGVNVFGISTTKNDLESIFIDLITD